MIDGSFHFSANLRRSIRIGREDQHHDPAPSMPSIMASLHSMLGARPGAIQHRMPSPSSAAQTASATVLSFAEWLMKTSCAMRLSDLLRARGYS